VFTGLVETTGKLLRRSPKEKGARLVVAGALAAEPLELGESIAVDGVCLTVASIVDQGTAGTPRVFEADASAETLAKTTLGGLEVGAVVNLERAVQLGARMGGHLVTGHVDGVGHIRGREPVGDAVKVTFEAPAELARFVAQKGSICVSGVSLTVNQVSGTGFDVVLVPHTLEKTSLKGLEAGAAVNLEVDILARYILRFLEASRDGHPGASDAAWIERLSKAGYL